jgi:phosphoribosylaminoimidazole carboxylase PurE protein
MNKAENPLVGIIMGSDSDLKTMKPAADMLTQFSVPHEVRIVSAHRTPERMAQYGREAVRNGLRVIIAGAGGSAHLPGMIASETRLPVLGVAIENTPDPLNCAIGSMIRMPKGIPLATMGKGEAAAANAGLEAVRILALQDEQLGEAYDRYMSDLAAEVEAKDAVLRETGPVAYLSLTRNETL